MKCKCTAYNFPHYPNKECPFYGEGTQFWPGRGKETDKKKEGKKL